MTDEEPKLKERELEWLLKPCEMYKDEYKDCKCMRARFNQYFVYGELLDCSQWKVDYENCQLWKSKDDDKAFEALLASEQKRRLKRLQPHYSNDIWTKRDKPPQNWNKPLPDWMNKKISGTLLEYKQKGIETGKVNDLDVNIPWCTIL
ncbi:UPF0545 protein C22orf39 homolog [Venturia canescens]|uniref:UPF0545 protein C22orf39 homolog n=1 Tax=Venturia canescens TaxID=32260 RepID=UPI001C9D2D39|nr:UPF0545 protein C22orf39 homolog [Venturia canescens]